MSGAVPQKQWMHQGAFLMRFPVGSGRRYRRSAAATQFSTPKSRMTHVANVFTHRVVYLTTDR
jgi:hypothetical protein